MHRTGNNINITIKSRPSTSCNSYFPNSNKNSKPAKLVSKVGESSCSLDTKIVNRHEKTTLRALSDYESGENNVEKATSSSASFPSVNTRIATKETTAENVCCTSIKFKDSFSSDSNEILIRLTNKQGSMRGLSDYETGDSIDQSEEPLLNLIWSKQNSNNSENSFQQNDTLNSSSDSDAVYKIIRNKSKRPHHLFSSSDSSDSDTPLKQQRFRKRKRIKTSSEESDDDNTTLNITELYRRGKPKNGSPRTSGGIENPDPRIQMTRQLRTKTINCVPYVLQDNKIIRYLRGEISSYSPESSSSDDNLTRRDRSALNRRSELTKQNSTPATEQRVISRSRHRNNELEAPRRSLWQRDSETSSHNNSFNRTIRIRRFDSVSPPPLLRYVDSSDSDSVVLFEPRKVRGGRIKIHYSDSDSNSERTPSNVVSNFALGDPDVLANPLVRDANSSDSDMDSEKCPICFGCFGSKEVASPISCDHSFCTECIQEWAKNNNTCPIDRKIFNKIMVRSSFNGEVIHEIPTKTPPIEARFWESDDPSDEDEIGPEFSMTASSEEDEDICSICFSSNNPQMFISCDSCYAVYHMSCLTPPLRYVPACSWFCPDCVPVDHV